MDARRQTTVYAELLDPATGRIDGNAWSEAHAQGQPVARCRCGGDAYANPDEPSWREFFRQRWYTITCAHCGHETEVNAARTFTGPRLSRALLNSYAEVERRRLAEA